MKVSMSEDGVITLRAENSVEGFALRQWSRLAEQTTYVENPGAPAKRPVRAWSKTSLVVECDPAGGVA